jgi:hypothetical protein
MMEAGDLDASFGDLENLHRSVIDIDSGDVLKFEGTVNEIGLMHDLIHEYTHAEIIRAASMMEGALDGGYDDDIGGYVDTAPHYEKLSALWGGDPIKLFSPMDALSWPLGSSQHDADAIDGAIASVIHGLPATGVDWGECQNGSPLMYAIQEQHGRRTIEALCKRGAFFAKTEYDAAIRAMVCDASVEIMAAALDALMSNGHGHFILRLVRLSAEDMGTALHVCCSAVSVGEGLFDRIRVLLSHGVDAGRVTSVSNLRAADMLALRAKRVMVGSDPERELTECAVQLSRQGAGPIRHCLREVTKLMDRRLLPQEIKGQIVNAGFNSCRKPAAYGVTAAYGGSAS